MKKVYKSFLTILLVCSMFFQPKAVAWWSIIYSCENEAKEESDDIKFFFVEWFENIWSCKKR